ncbi:hypothetical protein R5H30_19150 [Sulfitobacter sp. D35]|uniref:hypothetical protein n=1 Tax=Sulfitobacter sp. D35 TaxID=3083252 RepID=UPI00296EA20D|nr:hypothetical protein [Sulfitobacter sp. D35]MDW4500112.1 hypothetical protein [Sulfitobacter sp. D35]
MKRYSPERIRTVIVPPQIFGTHRALFHVLRELDRPVAAVARPRPSAPVAKAMNAVRDYVRIEADEFVFATA